jgi:hypothetical protein
LTASGLTMLNVRCDKRNLPYKSFASSVTESLRPHAASNPQQENP